MWNSTLYALSVGGFTVGLAILVSTALWRWGQGRWASLCWLLLAFLGVPPYIHALAWSEVLRSVQNLLAFSDGFSAPASGWGVSWWGQSLALLPLAITLTLIGFGAIEGNLVEAALLLQSDWRTFWKIVLPLASPTLRAAGGLIFLFSLLDYSVPLLFQRNVYSLEIFAEYSATNQVERAFFLALPLLLICVLVLLFSLRGIRNIALGRGWGGKEWQNRLSFPHWFTYLQLVALGITALFVFVPLFVLGTQTQNPTLFYKNLLVAQSEIRSSFTIMLVTAVTSIFFALPIAFSMRTQHKLDWINWFLILLPIGIPPPLIGIGLISLWNHPTTQWMYGEIWIAILAALLRFASVAILVLIVQVRRIQPALFEADTFFNVSPLRRWGMIRLPLLSPGILFAATVVGILTLGELGATLIVIPAGKATLTLRIYNFLHYGANESVASLCLLLLLLPIFAAIIALVLSSAVYSRWRLDQHGERTT
ncbi:MAG: hypothetical protein N3D16_04455 [Anaerolineales bacterium]|nr:hypothetical protein [Anaerolineales bacterium]